MLWNKVISKNEWTIQSNALKNECEQEKYKMKYETWRIHMKYELIKGRSKNEREKEKYIMKYETWSIHMKYELIKGRSKNEREQEKYIMKYET